MPYKDPQRRYALHRKWLEANPDYMKAWRAAHPDEMNVYRRRWEELHPEEARIQKKDRQARWLAKRKGTTR